MLSLPHEQNDVTTAAAQKLSRSQNLLRNCSEADYCAGYSSTFWRLTSACWVRREAASDGRSAWWQLMAFSSYASTLVCSGSWWLRQERLHFWEIKYKGGSRKGEAKYEMCDTLQWCSYLGSSWMTQQIPNTMVLILWAVIQTPHVQPTQIRESIISNCHRQKPNLLKTI